MDNSVVSSKKKKNSIVSSTASMRNTNRAAKSIAWHDKAKGFEIDMREVSLVLTNKKDPSIATSVILDKVSAVIKPGRLLAIMGPSGAGKSSVLNVLGGRTQKNKRLRLFGKIFADGKVVDWRVYRRSCAYVTQDDLLFSNLTVHETMLLAARFRLPKEFTDAQRTSYADEIIAELGLNKVRDVVIGDDRTRGVSGGEKKRVQIGVEIISSPPAIFLDEPTTGLDAFQALKVMTSIKNLAHGGRTVVASIHQPRSSIVSLIDDLMLMSEGNVMYFGPLNECAAHMHSVGHTCPTNFNPADFFIDIVSVDSQEPVAEERTRATVVQLAAAYLREGGSEKSLAALRSPAAELGGMTTIHEYNATWKMQFKQLFYRSLKQRFRDKAVVIIPLVSNIVFGLLLGMIYWQSDYEESAIQDRIGVLFFVILNTFFGALFGVVNTFPIERSIVMRERASKMYSCSAYFLAKVASDVPTSVFFPVLYTLILYWMIGLNQQIWEIDATEGALRLLTLMGVLVTVYFTAAGFGLMISSVAKNVQSATAMAPPLVIFFILFGGFYANTENIPTFISWIEYISPVRWGFSALVINEFEGTSFECSPFTLQIGACPPSGLLPGNLTIDRLSFNDDSIGRSVAFLAGLAVIFHLGAYTLLRTRKDKFMEPVDAPHSFVSLVRASALKDVPLVVSSGSSSDDSE